MKILVTGSNGFLSKNLIANLRNYSEYEVFEVNRNTTKIELEEYCKVTDFVFHFAGVNRPLHADEFKSGNIEFTKLLTSSLYKYNNKSPIVYSSSIQATFDNPYGQSKREAEEILLDYGNKAQTKVLIYRFPNVFGKWCRPNYNSVIATFCYNICHDLPIKINDENIILNLVYIDDVVNEMLRCIKENQNNLENYCKIEIQYNKNIKDIAALLLSFKETRNNLFLPDLTNDFNKKLYSTYLSYLQKNDFIYDLVTHSDYRGSFTEFIKTQSSGQISVNVSKPLTTKGNHWHNTKNEKFLVVSGIALVKFRNIESSEVLEYYVSGEKLQVIDIPVGYVHNIINIGNNDLITIMWANEIFDPQNHDTHKLEV